MNAIKSYRNKYWLKGIVLILAVLLVGCSSGGDDGGGSPSPTTWRIKGYVHDVENDGTMDTRWSFNYDDQGDLASINFDASNDGSVDGVWSYTYYQTGYLHEERYHDNAEGTDWIGTYYYDDLGNAYRYEVDNNADGVLDEVWYDYYDSNGTWLKQEFDNYNDGELDRIVTNFYNSAGYLIRQETYYAVDDSVDVDYLTYNASGDLIKEEFDYYSDGVIDEYWTYEYDAQGRQIKETYVFIPLDEVEVSYFTYHDPSGFWTQRDYDIDNNGGIDYVIYCEIEGGTSNPFNPSPGGDR